MNINDPVGDMLTRIRNGQQSRKSKIITPDSKARRIILDILTKEGYIRGYSVETLRPGISQVVVELKYIDSRPVITTVSRVSKPGRRVYSSSNKLKSIHSGLGMNILSTSSGVMTEMDARAKGIGGEVICKIF